MNARRPVIPFPSPDVLWNVYRGFQGSHAISITPSSEAVALDVIYLLSITWPKDLLALDLLVSTWLPTHSLLST